MHCEDLHAIILAENIMQILVLASSCHWWKHSFSVNRTHATGLDDRPKTIIDALIIWLLDSIGYLGIYLPFCCATWTFLNPQTSYQPSILAMGRSTISHWKPHGGALTSDVGDFREKCMWNVKRKNLLSLVGRGGGGAGPPVPGKFVYTYMLSFCVQIIHLGLFVCQS